MITQLEPDTLRHSLVLCAISGRTEQKREKQEQKYRVSIYSGMTTVQKMPLKGRIPRLPRAQAATRGIITQFSKRSRKRMIESLAKKDDWNAGHFWTLTLPDEYWFACGCDYEKFNTDLVALFRRIERAFPNAGFIWRKEITARKSGKHIGKDAPHVHILIDGLQEDIGTVRCWLRQAWHEVLTDGRCDLPKRPRIDVEGIGSSRKAMYYVSKYTAKVTEQLEKLENCNNQQISVGRWWGVRGNWNEPVIMTVVISRQQYLRLRRYVRRLHKVHGRDRLARYLTSDHEYGFMFFLGGGSPGDVLDVWETDIGRLVEDLLFLI